jgi:acetylornithine/N-succinyldiaminopimelate aminotransferase
MLPRHIFYNNIAQTTPAPLAFEVSSASGIYLYNENKKAHIDLIAGISVSNIGHCHPTVVKAIQDQAALYSHTMVYGEHIQSPQTNLAQLLLQQLPVALDQIYFLNSGSEATECAMKMVKKFTGRAEIISFSKAYHGSTQGALSLMDEPYFTHPFKPLLPGIKYIAFNNYSHLTSITENTAAVFIELVKVESGVLLIDKDYLIALQARCKQTNTLIVLDEIQTGIGRTGKLFAMQHFNFVPDVLLLGKALGGGLPLSAVVANKKILSCLANNPILGHITTFGGNPICSASGLAQLQVLLANPTLMDVCHKETLFRALLKHPLIKSVNSFGMLFAIELGSFQLVEQLMHQCLKNGVLVDWFLFNNTAIRIAPPLIITEEEIEKACRIIISSLNELN